jgi:hypothetical protein
MKGSRVTDSNAPATPPGRTPGKYVIYAIAVFGILFLGGLMLLATQLEPAAKRFHDKHPKATQKE